MKPPAFEYACPATLTEALELLRDHSADVAVLAGGQSLMPMLNLRVAQPAILVDINDLPDMDAVACDGKVLTIGGRARHNDVLRSPIVLANAPLLVQALAHVAHEAIRNRGTFGGSLALADPAAELPACAVCLGVTVIAMSAQGERRIAASDFFQGLYTTALEPDELITKVEIPVAAPGWRFSFDEIARRHGDFAIAGLAVGMRCEGNVIADCRLVYCGLEDLPRRADGVEKALIGSALDDMVSLDRAKDALHAETEPLEGGEFPPEYRLHVAAELLSRMVRNFAAEAQEGKFAR